LGLPRSKKGNDAVWVIVDRLTKSTLFLLMRISDFIDKLARLYVNEVVQLHGVSVSVISDRDPHITLRLCPSIQRVLGIKLNLSIIFHPQTDG
jgi:hypothetical protein